MKKILLFGAGKSATALIDYLLDNSKAGKWELLIADADKAAIDVKIAGRPAGKGFAIDIKNETERRALITETDLVISLMPPFLHILIARDCIQYNKNLLTASYEDAEMKALDKEAKEKGLLFLCEMGLDPGIDHMSAMEMFDRIRSKGGIIRSFRSHCGGLVAPESDDNPWHYKISWNPRNIVTAGMQGAIYRFRGETVEESYEALFDPLRTIQTGIDNLPELSYYPNRNSLPYIDMYGLQQAHTFIRTTLRHPEFVFGWKNITELKLTDDSIKYPTKDITLRAFFTGYLKKHGFENWLQEKLTDRFQETKQLLDNLLKIIESEEEAKTKGDNIPANFMIIDDTGNLKNIEIDEIKNDAASTMAKKMHEANLTMKQLLYLGLDDDNTIIPKDESTAADVLQFALEKKLILSPADKDMAVMLHETEYEIDNQKKYLRSLMVVKGQDSIHTAIAKTVGTPLGIAAKLILENRISLTGVHIPIQKEIYLPVLEELKNMGIEFNETETDIS